MAEQLASLRWKSWFIGLTTAGIFVNLLGLLSPIMEPDGALYASIAKTMVLQNDWINLYAHNQDWLDKPHFPFWMTALSYSIFGINSVAYKIPALIFWGLGGWFTWKIAVRLYSIETAQIAVLIYLTALHLLISNNDVRAEPYLTGLLAAAVYFLLPTVGQEPVIWRRVLGAAFLAAAVMTKGIFVVIPVAVGFWLEKRRENREGRKPIAGGGGWWIVGLLTGLFILPELYSLYAQFDRHPEKIVFGRTGVSGLRFFFWDSQFGRFLNTGPIKGKGDPFFFLHTLLWAFLPWSILLYTSIGAKIRSWFKRQSGEWVLTGISLSCFLLFSASRFQLPHYMNIVFPFFAIVTANWLLNNLYVAKWIRVFSTLQWSVTLICFVGCISLWALMYPSNYNPLIYCMPMLATWISFLLHAWKTAIDPIRKMVIGTCIGAIALYGFLNLYFYPALLQYQSGNKAAEWVNTKAPDKAVYTIQPYSYSLDFYSKSPTLYTTREEAVASSLDSSILLYTSSEQLDTLRQSGYAPVVLDSFPHYHISKLKIGFLLPNKRAKYLQYRYLAELKK